MMNPEALAHTPEETLAGMGVETPATGEESWRAGTWGLLAALLWRVPDRETLEQVGALEQVEGAGSELQVALAMLGLAARSTPPEAVDDEFHDLFIGMGRGELLPYGSWYQTGFLMERPLSLLREDLVELGYQRDASVKEPEDHVAALCEVMALMIQEGQPQEVQEHFFSTHIDGWMGRFFEELSNAESAVFYRSVGRLGEAFIRFERTYLSMQ